MGALRGELGGSVPILELWKLGVIRTQREVRKLISGLNRTVTIRLLSCNRTQSKFDVGLCKGHNTSRRCFYVMGWKTDLCGRCGAKEQTSAHVLRECEALASPRRTYLDSFLMDPEDVKESKYGGSLEFSKGTGLPWLGFRLQVTKA